MHYRRGQITLGHVILSAAILMIAFIFVMFPVVAGPRRPRTSFTAQNNRQMALGAIMYGGDYDDRIPLTINGWLCRMQNVNDKQLTVNAPAPGTQDFPAPNAAGGKRTDAWPLLIQPYIRTRGLLIDPLRGDKHGIFRTAPKAVGEAGYNSEAATYRNQNRFPMYGVNYMYLSPLRIPKDRRKLPDAVNYAVSESHEYTEADDISATIFSTESKRSAADSARGFFVVNAPGMWPAFAKNKDGFVAFWSGTDGSGDWTGDVDPKVAGKQKETNFVYTGYSEGCTASFLDGHVKYYKDAALAQGTDYLASLPGKRGHVGSGAKIIDKSRYLWNLSNKNYYGM